MFGATELNCCCSFVLPQDRTAVPGQSYLRIWHGSSTTFRPPPLNRLCISLSLITYHLSRSRSFNIFSFFSFSALSCNIFSYSSNVSFHTPTSSASYKVVAILFHYRKDIPAKLLSHVIKTKLNKQINEQSRESNLVPRAFSSTIFKMADRHFENRRGERPGDEVGRESWIR